VAGGWALGIVKCSRCFAAHAQPIHQIDIDGLTAALRQIEGGAVLIRIVQFNPLALALGEGNLNTGPAGQGYEIVQGQTVLLAKGAAGLPQLRRHDKRGADCDIAVFVRRGEAIPRVRRGGWRGLFEQMPGQLPKRADGGAREAVPELTWAGRRRHAGVFQFFVNMRQYNEGACGRSSVEAGSLHVLFTRGRPWLAGYVFKPVNLCPWGFMLRYRSVLKRGFTPQRAFSLIEAAIVLGVVGLVIGGIWVGAAAVNRRLQENRALADISMAVGRLKALWPAGIGSPSMGTLYDHRGYFPDDILHDNGGGTYVARLPWGSTNYYDLYVYGTEFHVRLGNVPVDVCKSFAPRLAGVFANEPRVSGAPAYGGLVVTDGDGQYNVSTADLANVYCDLDSSDGLTVPIMLYLTR